MTAQHSGLTTKLVQGAKTQQRGRRESVERVTHLCISNYHFPLSPPSECSSRNPTGEIIINRSLTATHFSYLCYHKDKLPNDAGMNPLLGQCSLTGRTGGRDRHTGEGNNFKSLECKIEVKKKYKYICIRCCGVLLSFLLFTLLHPSNAKRRGPCTTSLTASHRTNRSFACKPAPAAVTQEGRYLKVFSKELEIYFLLILFR